MNHNIHLQKLVLAALMAALTAAGAYMVIPIGPVPIVLQSLFVLLSGLLLGGRWAAASMCVYLLAGIIGLPVFAGGSGGFAKLLGPTGGYLVGFPLAAFLIGTMTARGGGKLWRNLLALIVGTLLIYLCGVTWLKTVLDISFGKALGIGMWPFLPGDALKIAAALALERSLRPLMAEQRHATHYGTWPSAPHQDDA
ncbi:MAG: biotin transporter BioY [Desulfosarcinaceae bacterium]|nr:biotin transporter BioY [Desulfosarcinaceae bacterium]